jgi:hypothetical protein
VTEPTQVFIVTSGCYSDYSIESVYFTLEQAEAAIAPRANESEWSRPTIEVWPVGDNERTLGTFSRSVDLWATSGEVAGPELTYSDEGWPPEKSTQVLCWGADSDRIGIRVVQDSAERADKVYGELKFRVTAQIAEGLPPFAIADQTMSRGGWRPIRPEERP